MKLHHLTLALGLTALLSACDQAAVTTEQGQSASAQAASVSDDSPVIATVNGTAITERALTIYQQQRHARRPNDPSGTDRNAILEELINLELTRQAGVQQGLDKQAEVQIQLDQQRRAVIAAAVIQQQLKDNPVSDAKLQELYDANVGGGQEYKARHILVEEQEKAAQLIVELDGGADFAELAKQHSTGPSGKSGGDLGWFSAGQMVQPFSDAVADMEKGSYSKEPVQTQFGWHVIMLEDARETTVPSFEQVKQQLRMVAQNQNVKDYISGLRGAAKIEIVQAATPPETTPAQDATPDSDPAPDSDAAPGEQTGGE
jgi:peptidyl-prolyl cis-trans isomerase C